MSSSCEPEPLLLCIPRQTKQACHCHPEHTAAAQLLQAKHNNSFSCIVCYLMATDEASACEEHAAHVRCPA